MNSKREKLNNVFMKSFENIKDEYLKRKARNEDLKRKLEIENEKVANVEKEIEKSRQENDYLLKHIRKEEKEIHFWNKEKAKGEKQNELFLNNNSILEKQNKNMQLLFEENKRKAEQKREFFTEKLEYHSNEWQKYREFKQSLLPTETRENLLNIQHFLEEKREETARKKRELKESQNELFRVQCEHTKWMSEYGFLLNSQKTVIHIATLRQDTLKMRQLMAELKPKSQILRPLPIPRGNNENTSRIDDFNTTDLGSDKDSLEI